MLKTNLNDIFGDSVKFNSLTEEEQLIFCQEYFPIGTVVDLDVSVMGDEPFTDGTITAKVIGYKAVAGTKFDNYCVLLDKDFSRNNRPARNFIHPSLLLYNRKYFREMQLDKLL